MTTSRWTNRISAAAVAIGCLSIAVKAAEPIARIDERFSAATVTETPDFRQHVVPLISKLGCNGRACHGSFQGRGGFRLSLFGYDFKADHEALSKGDQPRVNLSSIHDSLILQKPLQVIPHEGGTRLTEGTWQHRVLIRWLEGGARPVADKSPELVRLEVSPSEVIARRRGESFALKAVAVWSNGISEDVTPLCRFQTNNDRIATIDDKGLVTSADAGDTHVVVFYDSGVVPVPVIRPVSDKFGPAYPAIPTPTKIDELVAQKLQKLGMIPSDVCSDAEFVRRVSLDMTGTLPTVGEVEAFLADQSTDKRARKIDELLERPAYAAWWATRFADWTGNNASKLNNVKSVVDNNTLASDWYEWLRTRIEKNVSYDQLAEGIILAVSRQPEESYGDYCARMSGYYGKEHTSSFADQPSMIYYWTRREFQKPEDRALGFAYTFLGIRIQCAQCHKHPFDQWTKDDFDRFKEFFSRVQYGTSPAAREDEKEMLQKANIDAGKLKGNDLAKAIREHLGKGEVMPFGELFVPAPNRRNAQGAKGPAKRPQVAGRTAKILGGDEVRIEEMTDPREALMSWLRDETNPYFSRAIVNRIWAGYFNVGIVEPADDLSLANPPSNEALLDYLADQFRQRHYNMKWLHRTIANSRTYQLSWQSNETNQFDERNFARAVLRRLPAEVAYDALQLATMNDTDAAQWQSVTAGRAIGNPVVATRPGGKGKANQIYALNIFGRSVRNSNCECDRSSESSLLQTVYLQNDNEVLAMISGKGRWVDQVLKSAESQTDPKMAAQDGKERPQRRLAEIDTERLKVRLLQAQRAGKTEQVERIRKVLAPREQNPVDRPADPAGADQAASRPSKQLADLKSVIRQAYLRTVSRYPTDAESDRAEKYYAETGDVVRGTRDLLWALVNTKEFVVNH